MSQGHDWTFHGFAGEFDGHVREQLPWYELASAAMGLIARQYIPKEGKVYDLGASTGNVGRVLAPTLEARCARLTALDECPDMVEAYNAPGRALRADITRFDYKPFDVAVAFLVFMFLAVPARRKLLELAFEFELLERIDLFRHMNVIAVGDIALVGDALDNAKPLLQTLGELIRGGLQRRAVQGEVDVVLCLPLFAGGVQRVHDLQREGRAVHRVQRGTHRHQLVPDFQRQRRHGLLVLRAALAQHHAPHVLLAGRDHDVLAELRAPQRDAEDVPAAQLLARVDERLGLRRDDAARVEGVPGGSQGVGEGEKKRVVDLRLTR